MSTVTATIADFYMTSSWTCNNGAFAVYPSQVTTYKQAVISGIPADSRVTNAVLSVSLGSPVSGIDVLKINGQNASEYAASTYTQNISSIVSGNGTITIPIIFRAYGDATMSDGEHSGSLTFSNFTITVTYESGATPEPEPEVLAGSNKLVCLFGKDETRFSGNGLCVLNPVSCNVEEVAGGMYELKMVHPIDQYGKWAMIENESIIRAPVPPNNIPEITIPAASVWKVKSSVTSTPLYTVLPHYTAAQTEYDAVLENPSGYAWQSGTPYTVGDIVTFQGGIYKARYNNTGYAPNGTYDYWEYIMDVDGSGGSSGGIYDPGVVAETLASEETITKIADYSGMYMQVRSLRGVVGYVARGDVELTSESATGTVIPSRTIVTQLFRVYKIECEDDTHTVNVKAKHISYDFQHNAILDCQLVEADPATAIAIMQGSLITADERLIACNITGQKLDNDWSFQNPVYALLDPESGLLQAIGGKLIRDNADFFLLDDSTQRSGPRISYGANMLGVKWARDTEDVVTRVIPRCGDGNDGYLYLDEMYVDSPYINDYSFPRVEILEVDCYIGKEVKHADGTTQTMTREDCLQLLREKAQNRFTVDKVDAMTITLDVQFVLLGDTEEFSQYRDLQRLNLYDAVKIDTGISGMSITAQVSGYEWDCLMRRYLSITIGDVFAATKRKIPGYRMNNKTITYSKLSPGLISRIKGES